VSAGWDAIVIGSGIGGLACAAALTKAGRRVLVLEQHSVAGGLTQTFTRDGYTWDVGVHYLGQMGRGGAARRVLDWLSDRAIEFASIGPVYDTVRFPGGFEFQYSRPEAALRQDLAEKFPGHERDIDGFLEAIAAAEGSARAVFAPRAMPGAAGLLYGLLRGRSIRKWWDRTSAEVVRELIAEPKLGSVLLAAWGDHGGNPATGSFGMHALVMRHYLNGAFYPVGGAQSFARGLVAAIRRGGGEVRTGAQAAEIVLHDGRACGVRLAGGETLAGRCVVSDAGAINTVKRLLPEGLRGSSWAREVLSFTPSLAHLQLYLGLEGELRALGASASNYWLYDTWDTQAAVWRDPFEQPVPPMVFIAFPTLKDPRHEASAQRHTAEVVAFTEWKHFAQWSDTQFGQRPPDYQGFKELIARRLEAQFARHFPALAPLIRYRELSTPLSTAAFTGAFHGASYGLEVTPRRFRSRALAARTPVPGLLLAGQDVASPGVTGAMMGGVLAAAALEPRLASHLS
jgi:phytoene dehydrogenase-like protein